MAVGLGLMMNIEFPQNFNSPYKSKSITEFWQRWHITLSSWLRDYLYISLGGNRGSLGRTYRNLFLTMAIGGLWHGANWTYLVWGAFHGALLTLERFFKDRKIGILRNKYLSWALTLILVGVGWVFFRASSVGEALFWLKKASLLLSEKNFNIGLIPIKHKDRFFAALSLGVLISLFSQNTWQREFKPRLWRAALLALMFVLCLMYLGEESPFLYFQF
jgi:alginate O-acetyltransferase complex protein AlgI